VAAGSVRGRRGGGGGGGRELERDARCWLQEGTVQQRARSPHLSGRGAAAGDCMMAGMLKAGGSRLCCRCFSHGPTGRRLILQSGKAHGDARRPS